MTKKHYWSWEGFWHLLKGSKITLLIFIVIHIAILIPLGIYQSNAKSDNNTLEEKAIYQEKANICWYIYIPVLIISLIGIVILWCATWYGNIVGKKSHRQIEFENKQYISYI